MRYTVDKFSDILGGDNQHITEYLDYYVFDKKEPEFAVLLTGKWGIGKTYYIDAYSGADKLQNSKIILNESELPKKKRNWFIIYLVFIFRKLVSVGIKFDHYLAFEPDRLNKVLSRNEKLKKYNIRLIKISVFGIKTVEELESRLTKSIFGNFNILSDIASLLIKNANISNFANPYFSLLKAFIPLTTFPDFKKRLKSIISSVKKHNLVFIFDDLERSDIPLKEFLGWINQVVEIEKMKVILIANEEKLLIEQSGISEIEDNEKNNKDRNRQPDNVNQVNVIDRNKQAVDPEILKKSYLYKEFKEKVIGKTFKIHSNFEAVVDYFLFTGENGTEPNKYKKLIVQHHDFIKRIYKDGQIATPNLRGLKQAIDDCEYLLQNIKDDYYPLEKDNELTGEERVDNEIKRKFIDMLIENFFILKLVIIEWKITDNDLSEKIMKDINKISVNLRYSFNNDPPELEEIYAKNYKLLEIMDKRGFFYNNYLKRFFLSINSIQVTIFEMHVWVNILFRLDFSNIDKNIKSFFDKNRKDLLDKLFFYRLLDEKDFQNLLNEFSVNYFSLKYLDFPIFFHYLGLIIHFNENKLIKEDIKLIKSYAEIYIRKYCKTWIINYGNIVDFNDLNWNNPKNYDFASRDNPVFSEILEDFKEPKEEYISELSREEVSEKLKKIIQMLRGEENNDFDNVIYFNDENRQKEIFINNDYIAEFVQAIVNCKNSLIHDFHHALHLRYNSNHSYNKEILIKEEPFWQTVVEKLTKYIKDYDSNNSLKTVKIVNLELLIKEIQEFINKPQKSQEQ
nr:MULTISPECIES: P-loop NTPase fold protein [Commensalibacter]